MPTNAADAPDPVLTVIAAGGYDCPICGYALHGIESARCPECGIALDVRITADVPMGAWLFALVSVCAGCAIAVLFVLLLGAELIRERSVGGSEILTLAGIMLYAVLLVGAIVLLTVRRHRLWRRPLAQQRRINLVVVTLGLLPIAAIVSMVVLSLFL